MRRLIMTTLTAASTMAASSSFLHGDEGMWTLDNLPVRQLQERYGFSPSPAWVEHVRLASVRFNDGGSGSFVSPGGLVLTNHHVALGQLQKVSSEKKDYVKDGFFARERSQELKCPDLELNVLQSFEDVTARVLKAVDPGSKDKERNEQRKAEMSRIEKESTEKTGFRSDVVELYQGGEYWLHRYKKYKDIRLVMAPEFQAAFYGGDPDNFTYPRFDLDFAVFRVYEEDKPVQPKHWLKWSKEGAKDGALVFVTGHPGSTDRLRTAAQLEFERDLDVPVRLKSLKRHLAALREYSNEAPEKARRAKDRIFGIENSIKAISGELEGLQDPKLFARLLDQETELRRKTVAAGPKGAAQDLKDAVSSSGDPWGRIASAQKELASRYKDLTFRRLSGARRVGSKLAGFADTIVRYVVEIEKPNDKRFEEFRDSALDSLKFRLFSPAPVYPDLEETLLGSTLRESADELGPSDPFVKLALGDRAPEELARELVRGTKLADPDFRKKLVEGGKAAVEASDDPLIVLARRLDPGYRELRKWYEDGIQSVESLDGQRIAQARFAAYGKTAYPDATFTLRLSYGKVAGYERGTTSVPPKTTFYGLFDRSASHEDKPPFDLAPTLASRKKDLDLSTPLNFVTTNDIIGGNSGSPVFDKDAELVGLIFDGNIESLVWRYAYTDERGRAVAVHSSAILEALRSAYRMPGLVEELTR